MSCPNSTAPIDISISKIKGKCDYKCAFSFNYKSSACVATNRDDYISISYDRSSSPPVTYNASAYDVKEIRLYTPSLHSYSGSKTEGELIVVHTSNTGANALLVCMPIKSNNSSSVSALFFKKLVDTVASSAPSDGESTTVNVQQFNLSSFVPKKPFFSYSATEPYQPCSSPTDYIVFTPLEASLDILPETLETLEKVIISNSYDVKTGPSLFYNEKGPNQNASSDEIYIDCQPVGSSVETTEVFTGYNDSSFSFQDLLKNPVVQIILGALIFIIILFLIKYGLNQIGKQKLTNPFSNVTDS